METLWISPTEYVLAIPHWSSATPLLATQTRSSRVRGLVISSGVSMGLRLPPNVSVENIIVCYQITSKNPNQQPQSFISQVRLVEMDKPDQALVIHDDGTDLRSTSPVCYTSNVGSKTPTPGKAVTLGLRLNFRQTPIRFYWELLALRFNRPKPRS